MLKVFKRIASSFNAPLHVILRRFKIVPILVLLFFLYLTWDLHVFYKGIALQLQEWQVVPLLGVLATLIATIMKCLDAVRLKEEEDEHDKE